MAIIKPNNNTISAITALPTGLGGKVLQVVTDEMSSNVSTNSDSYSDISGLSVSITPSATSSKIYVIANLCSARGANSGFHSCNVFFNLVRDST